LVGAMPRVTIGLKGVDVHRSADLTRGHAQEASHGRSPAPGQSGDQMPRWHRNEPGLVPVPNTMPLTELPDPGLARGAVRSRQPSTCSED
jgi:hypothetical protein